jgi:hypothetical protein
MLAWNETRIDSFSNRPNVTVRFGAAMTWKMLRQLHFNIFGVYEIGTGKPLFLTQCRFDYRPAPQWTVSVGNMSTPTTELRPYPVSTGHFETWTMARIPGLTPGVKVRFSPTSSFSMASGLALRHRQPEYHFSVTLSPVTAAVYYQAATNNVGVAAKITTKKVYSIAVYNNRTLGNTSSYSFKSYMLYNDCGYSIVAKQIVRWESGFLKKFEGRYVSGLVGFGFDAKTCTLNSYLFVHL